MSEEEKKAIDYFNNLEYIEIENDEFWNNRDRILNLIENQQKEIEELNEIKQQICNEELITQDYVQNNFISKDKIREKIKKAKEIKWHTPKLVIEYFEELLEENNNE